MIALIVTGVVLVISELWYLIYRYVNLHGEYDARETWPFLWPVQVIRWIWPEHEEPKAEEPKSKRPYGTIQIIEVLNYKEEPEYIARKWVGKEWWYLCKQEESKYLKWWCGSHSFGAHFSKMRYDTPLEAQEAATELVEYEAMRERIESHHEVVGEFKPGGSN